METTLYIARRRYISPFDSSSDSCASLDYFRDVKTNTRRTFVYGESYWPLSGNSIANGTMQVRHSGPSYVRFRLMNVSSLAVCEAHDVV